jgi:phosphopantetheine attachment domain protein
MREDLLELDKIIQILNANLENTEITQDQMEDDLLAIGMDSIAFIRVLVALEEAFEIEIPDEKILMTEMNTVSKIVNTVTASLNKKHESSANIE